jgi:lysyl-tRNA synthetase class 2
VLGLGSLAAGIAAVAIAAGLRGTDLPNRAADSLTAVGIVAGFAALYFWLRPFGQAVAQTVGERRVARTLVETYGTDSLSFFALRRDKSYLFSPSGKAFLAYRVVAGTALMSGDPVGEDSEIDDLLAELQALVRAHGWRLAVVGASEYNLPRYRARGL